MAKGLWLPKKKEIIVPANIWKRIGAFVIDLLIIDFIISPFTKVLENIIPIADFRKLENYLSSNMQVSNAMIFVTFAIGIISLLYFAILEYKYKQTIGKMIFKIYIASEDKELRLSQCIIRSLFIIPVIPFVFFMIIDPLYLLFSKTDKRLLEKWSKTKTLQTIIIG